GNGHRARGRHDLQPRAGGLARRRRRRAHRGHLPRHLERLPRAEPRPLRRGPSMKLDDLFKGGDLDGYTAGGHGRRIGFGKKPALVLVDLINLYMSPKYALGHGENSEAVIAANARLLEAARKKRVPVFFSNVGLRGSAAEKGMWGEKVGGSKG